MRRSTAVLLLAALIPAAPAQQRKLKTDVLGLPPMPGAKTIGSIRLPLEDILRPEPGQTMTGPKLTDLAILTYRVPLATPRDKIVAHYRLFAPQYGWKLLDELADSSTNRALVFHSKSAPGYLTVDIANGPDETIQVDLTRLLGDVNPTRPGEVYKLTGKRPRLQKARVTAAGRFLDLKTGQLVRTTVPLTEASSEAGVAPEAARYVAPQGESYVVVALVNDVAGQMTRVELFSGNSTRLASSETRYMGGSATLTAKLRSTQGLNVRVVISGPEPNAVAANAAAKKPAASGGKPPAKPVAKAATPAQPAGTKPLPDPGIPITTLVEWQMRPPLTALPEARRVSTTTRTETRNLAENVELGSTCEGPITVDVPWRTATTEQFGFSPDYFGMGLARTPAAQRTGVLNVQFPIRSGQANAYSLNQNVTTTVTIVELGYTFAGQWVMMPPGKKNPASDTYTVTAESQPTVTKKTTGVCQATPPKPATTAPAQPAAPAEPPPPAAPGG